MVQGTIADLGIPGMFWTQDLKSFTVCFALGIVHITEKSGGSEMEDKCSGFKLKSLRREKKESCHTSILEFSYPSILVGYMDPKDV